MTFTICTNRRGEEGEKLIQTIMILIITVLEREH